MKKPVTLAALFFLTSCQTGPRLSDLTPLLGPGNAQLAASAAVNTSVPVQISAPVTASWTLNITSHLDVCVLPGHVTLTPDVRDTCLTQTALPTGVRVTPGAPGVTTDTVTLTRNTSRTFTHSSALTFTAAGRFTVFPRQQVQAEIADPSTRVSPGTGVTID